MLILSIGGLEIHGFGFRFGLVTSRTLRKSHMSKEKKVIIRTHLCFAQSNTHRISIVSLVLCSLFFMQIRYERWKKNPCVSMEKNQHNSCQDGAKMRPACAQR